MRSGNAEPVCGALARQALILTTSGTLSDYIEHIPRMDVENAMRPARMSDICLDLMRLVRPW